MRHPRLNILKRNAGKSSQGSLRLPHVIHIADAEENWSGLDSGQPATIPITYTREDIAALDSRKACQRSSSS